MQHEGRAAHMQEATQPTFLSEAADPLAAAAYRAEAWAGEPFLRENGDRAGVRAPGTARRRALDEAQFEIEAGRHSPSSQWKVRFGLLLGLERVLAEPEPRTAAGTALRRHQIDALAGMLTELIAARQFKEEPGQALVEVIDEDDEEDDDGILIDDQPVDEEALEDEPEPLTAEEDPGAV